MRAATVSSAADHNVVVNPDRIAVIAHSGKNLDGGLGQLRAELAAAGVPDPRWFEVPKSKMAAKRVRAALDDGADLLFVWGGDGMVQRCVDEAAGSSAAIAIIPGRHREPVRVEPGDPQDLRAAVDIGLTGCRHRFDLGKINGEHFVVMAGAGMDALMIRNADGALKHRLGRAAYVVTGARSTGIRRVATRVRLDGDKWFDGKASCVLIGNVGKVMGNVPVFPEASPTDGILEVGIVTADGRWQWIRTLARTATGKAPESPFVEVARGRKIDVRFSRPVPYELDGGDRKKTRRLRVSVKSEAVMVCVPPPDPNP